MENGEKHKKKKEKFQRYPISFFEQFRILFTRATFQLKGVYFTALSFVQMALVIFILCVLWFQLPRDEDRIGDRFGILFFIVIYNGGFYPMFSALFNFPPERSVVTRERQEGAYYLSAYFAAKALGELPFLILFPLMYTIPVYWVVGLQYDAGRFFFLLLLIIITAFTAAGLGLAIGAYYDNLKKAQVVATVIMLLFLLVGGFYISSNKMPSWISWIQYLSYVKYTFDASIINEFSNTTFRQIPNVHSPYDSLGDPFPGDAILADSGIIISSIWGNIGVLIGYGVFYWILAFLFLKWNLKKQANK